MQGPSKRHILLLLSAIGLWCASYLFTIPVNDSSLARIGGNISEQIDELAVELDNDVQRLLARLVDRSATEWDLAEELVAQEDKHFLLSDVAWTSQGVALDTDLPEEAGVHSLQMPDGSYIHVRREQDGKHVDGLMKVLYDPPYENRYLRRKINERITVPDGIVLGRSGEGVAVIAPDGTSLFNVSWAVPDQGRVVATTAWWMRVLALVFLLPVIWSVSMRLSKSFGKLLGLVVVGLVAMTIAYVAPKFFDGSGELFDPSLYATSTVLASLGHLVFLAVSALFFASFVRQLLRNTPRNDSVHGMILSASLLLVLAALITDIMIGTVTDSTIDLNLFMIQHFGNYSLTAILAVALLTASWAILAFTLLSIWWPANLSWRSALILGILAIASALIHHFMGVRDTVYMFWPFVLILLLYFRGLADLRSSKLILVVAALAVFHAHVLNKHSQYREGKERIVLADRLAAYEDPVLERLYPPIDIAVRTDRQIMTLLSGEDPCPVQEIETQLRLNHFSEGYWERYQIDVHVFDAVNSFRCDLAPSNQLSWDELYLMYSSGADVPGVVDLHTTDSSITDVLYVAMIPISRLDGPGLSGYVFLRFIPRSAPEELGFPELLLAGEDPIDSRIRRYAFSEYRNGKQVRQFGDRAYPVQWVRHVNDGATWFEDDGYRDLAFRSDEVLVVIGTPLPTVLDKATTFSYLFMFYILLGVVLLLFWWSLIEGGGFEWTLRAKVRTALMLFVLIGSVLFGVGARELLVNSFAQRVDSDLREKTHSVLVELQHKLGDRDELSADMKPELDYLLRKFSKVFFSDITLYDLKGRLLATSRPQLFDAGLIGKRMAPDAYKALVLEGTSEFIHNEHVGELTYRSAYVPFMNENGRVLAYLDLPYFARQSELDNGLSALLVAIVNLFVLLFALSMLAALFISNWTTRPLAVLERSLAKVDLASTNSPLRYSGRDEIGRLVSVYNEKVNELKESAERLARSERESAWREMARQVAHEIKNPLTPMKLSIQHFERTWNPDQPDSQERLNRFSEGMVDQIDTLSRIAEEFAHFAKMPPSQDEEMNIVEAVTSALELFKNSTDVKISLEVDAEVDTWVVADNDHLVRVFNNLIKNAVQAIPESTSGWVKLMVRSDETHVIVEVSDNGNGIPDDIRERIFMPNFTTRSTGMGLGLAMVKRMVENSGGEVWFESTTGEGTTFYVSLPKARK